MRKLRLKNDGEGFYHVGSRCVDRTFRFDDNDKTHIVDQMRRMAQFCGIEVNTYAVMTNHFHILVHVLPKGELTDEELDAIAGGGKVGDWFKGLEGFFKGFGGFFKDLFTGNL